MSMSEGKYAGEFLVSEAPGSLSRENVTLTVAAGAKLQAGHVLAVLAANGKYVEYDNAGTDGSQTAAAVLYTGEADNSAGGAPADFSVVVVRRLAEVREADLTWFSGASAGDKSAGIADLATSYIVAR